MINGSFEFELDIGNIIKAFSILELEVENLKVLSIDSPHFDIYEVFSIITKNMKQEISLKDIVSFLNLNHIPTIMEEISILVEFSFGRKMKTLNFLDFTLLILPKTNAILTKEILKRNTKNEMNKPFHHYITISEYSEKQTAAILEKALSFLHEIKLLQNFFFVHYPRATTDDIYNTIIRLGKQKRLDFSCLENYFKGIGVEYTEEEFAALMRTIKAEDVTNLKRMDLLKIFFPELLNQMPPNLNKISAQRKQNKDCFEKFNEHLIRVNQKQRVPEKKIASPEKGIKVGGSESDFWKQIKGSRNIFQNKINFYDSDNFHHYLPLHSITKELKLRKESLNNLVSQRGLYKENMRKSDDFYFDFDYYKQFEK